MKKINYICNNQRNVRKPVGAGLVSARYYRGITLIALIITVIALLILAGVALNFVVGENGILKQAEFAKNKYQNAAEKEESDLDAILGYLNGNNQTLPDNTPTTDAGTPVKIPNEWQTETPNYTRTTDGKIVTTSTRIATVTAVSDGKGNTIPVPVGFYYVGGTLDSGVVISDNKADQNKYAGQKDVPAGIKVVEVQENGGTKKKIQYELVGNQFVWIPCDEKSYVKGSWSKGNITYWDTIVNSSELTQIEKYGGFYVGRFEAGLPEGTTEFETEQASGTDKPYNVLGLSQSKAGLIPWIFIDWNNSQKNARQMYKNNSYVSSGLITGTQWDVMINKISSATKKDLLDSKAWGNYYDGEGFTYTGRASEYKTTGYQQPFGSVVENATKTNKTYYLLTTGASDHNRAYNLYDVAGNVWEWTEETNYYNSASDVADKRLLRGGGCADNSSMCPVCFLNGEHSMEDTVWCVGFRVVLYMR